MSTVTRPRGRLPARVYWTRRALVLVVAFLLVFGIGKLLGGGGSDGGDEKAATTAAQTKKSTGSARPIGPVASKPVTPKKTRKNKAATPKSTPTPKVTLAPPSGPCLPDELTLTPVIAKSAAGHPVSVGLRLTGTQPACTFAVSPKSVVLKISSGKDRIWSSQDCPKVIPARQVVVRSSVPTTVPIAWTGRRSDSTCSNATKWADPGWYHAVGAALGSEPTDVMFQLTLPPRPVVTKTAHPKPTKTPAKKPTTSPTKKR